MGNQTKKRRRPPGTAAAAQNKTAKAAKADLRKQERSRKAALRRKKKGEQRRAKHAAAAPKREQQQEKRRGGISIEWIYRVLMLVAVVAAVMCVSTLFFRVRTVTVSGADHYLPESVATSARIPLGERLFYVDRKAAQQRIREQMPYVDTVKIRIRLPDQLEIRITECEPLAAVEYKGVHYIIDDDRKLLEYLPAPSEQSLLQITGLTPQEPTLGKTLATGDTIRDNSLQTILDYLDTIAQLGTVDTIDITRSYNVTVRLADRFTLSLGDTTQMDRKLLVLDEVLSRLEPEVTGVIDLSDPEQVVFTPDNVT